MLHRWNGPFDEHSVSRFLLIMREGANTDLYRTVHGISTQGPEHLGWLLKESGARFTAGGFAQSGPQEQSYAGLLRRVQAVQAFLGVQPEYVVHNSQWQPGREMNPVQEVTPEFREMVRKIIEDPCSGGNTVLENRKRNYWLGNMPPFLLAHYALMALGYKDIPDDVAKQLAPVATKAFDVFKHKRPDLEPW
jgi:hypothetical protein